MIATRPLSPTYSVAAALMLSDFAEAAALGFKTVINFRPDDEAAGQLTSDEAKRAAIAAGLAYKHIPAQKHDLFTDAIVSETVGALEAMAGPVLAACASGQRAAILWAAASARSQSVTSVLESTQAAGFNFDVLRDDLEAQADRARWNQTDHFTTTEIASSTTATRLAAA